MTEDSSEKVVMKQKLLDVKEVFVYRIPTLRSSGGHRAEDWDLSTPLQTCSLTVERRDDTLAISLCSKRPKENGPKGATEDVLFALCLVDLDSPKKKVEHFVDSVVDSSRYFVVRISDTKTGRHANIGVGFRERDDASNFRMALQEYERSLERERAAEAMHMAYEEGSSVSSEERASPALPEMRDLTLKEGEKIHIDLKGKSTKVKDTKPVKAGSSGGALPLLKKPPPSPAVPTAQKQEKIKAVGGIDLKDAISDVASTVGSECAVGSLTDDEEEEWKDFEG
mmetsp:Transcript_697/g.1296  ORF Transcript_697/g.1296 Transcript_697/m.1296 type:complete len:282 (+) Transcript_697:246-1091(+)|eukprot:CAMPEP_0202488928 /NCGR_PEP_ID=MMETSP1361-20130828/6823_1 /ASSEMBLY_ACC=CAM_ASM_000849 /TAXON_ID=210615 /ORGANISM="Staurosira complex sp., Strain CCMP2646" /LENGTH=281 /DNA_ID=CAMNT_0049118599 /DNA_START=181 /DNA_END=1026 /DNA_ORIENTATION=+